MIAVNRVRIVVGYPSDAVDGKNAVESCIAQDFFKVYCREHKLDVEVVTWETHAGPGIHKGGPQEWIDLALNIGQCDLFIAIFQGKLGTPYKGFRSGTVYEIDSAIVSFKERQSPQVWVCVPNPNGAASSAYTLTPELSEYIHTLNKVTTPDFHPLYLSYESTEDLFQKLSSWLFKFLIKQGPDKGSLSPAHSKLQYDAHSSKTDLPAEGIAVPAAPLLITISGDDSFRVGQWLSARVEVYINTNLTSPILGELSLTTLDVQEQDESFSGWTSITSVHGRQFAPNAISFDVTFAFRSEHRIARLRIEHLFVNANQLGVSTTAQESFVVAHVKLSAHNDKDFQSIPGNIQVPIGRICQSGFLFKQHSPAEQLISDLTVIRAKNKDWAVLRFSGKLSSQLPKEFIESLYRQTLSRAVTHCAPRLLIRMNGYAAKYVCVPTQLTSYSSSPTSWSFVQTDANGAARFTSKNMEKIDFEGKPYYVLKPGDSYMTSISGIPDEMFAAYEPDTETDAMNGLRDLDLQLLLLLELFPHIPFTTFSVMLSLAPQSTVNTSNKNAPIPRFFDMASSMSTSFRPKLTGS